MSALKQYLGDGVYVDYDGYQLVLTTENGHAVTNSIFVNNEVLAELLFYVDRIKSGGARGKRGGGS
jgi:hypothetical protein